MRYLVAILYRQLLSWIYVGQCGRVRANRGREELVYLMAGKCALKLIISQEVSFR